MANLAIIIVLHMICIELLNSNFIIHIGAMIVTTATNISIALHICDATSITEIAPIYNSELTMLDTMLLASNKFLFIVLFLVSLRKKEKYQKKERIYSLFL